MTEQELNIIPPRWLSISQVRQYAPAIGEKKIMAHIKKGHFKARLDGGEWVIDRFSIDAYFLEDESRRKAFVESTVAKVCGLQ